MSKFYKHELHYYYLIRKVIFIIGGEQKFRTLLKIYSYYTVKTSFGALGFSNEHYLNSSRSPKFLPVPSKCKSS